MRVKLDCRSVSLSSLSGLKVLGHIHSIKIATSAHAIDAAASSGESGYLPSRCLIVMEKYEAQVSRMWKGKI
jgi:hypothetical protein